MSTEASDLILMLHASEGDAWAKFLVSRLSSPSYGINSRLTNVEEYALPPPLPSSPHPSSTTAARSSLYENDEDSIYINDSTPTVTPPGGSTVESNNYQNDLQNRISVNPSLHQKIDENRVCVIIITPDIIESEKPLLCLDFKSLQPKRTIFLFLGVDSNEVWNYFGTLSDHVRNCGLAMIDGSEEAIRDAIVTIIAGYEYVAEEEEEQDGIYNTPSVPIQKIAIEKVFPRNLTETERDVYILLKEVPEDDIQVVCNNDDTLTFPLALVCGRLYTFTLPVNVFGEVTFQLECKGRQFGYELIHSYSKLDLIQNVLTSEINPYALMMSCLGLDKDDVGELDTTLAFKLRDLAPVMTFKYLCPCENSLVDVDEKSDKMWPTLLHFAAEYNLRLLCSELLRYPGMLAAACTMNRDGEYPSLVASRKGFHQLEKDLVHFIEHARNETDPDYFCSSQLSLLSDTSSVSSLTDAIGTTRHGAGGSLLDFHTDTYMNMSGKGGKNQTMRQPLIDENQRSASTLNLSRPPVRTHSDGSDMVHNKYKYSQRPLPETPHSPSTPQPEDTEHTPSGSPKFLRLHDSPDSVPSSQGSSPSSKALKKLGVTEQDIQNRYSVTVDPATIEYPLSSFQPSPDGALVSLKALKQLGVTETEIFNRYSAAIKNSQCVPLVPFVPFVPTLSPQPSHGGTTKTPKAKKFFKRKSLSLSDDVVFQSTTVEFLSRSQSIPPTTENSSNVVNVSSKALRKLGASKHICNRYSATLDPRLIAQHSKFYSASTPPGFLRKKLFEDEVDSKYRLSVSSNCDEPPHETELPRRGRLGSDQKSPLLKDGLKKVLNKIRGNSKKSGHESMILGKKNSGGKTRRGSGSSTSSATISKPHLKKTGKSLSLDEERDSGSYSDEEKKDFVATNKPWRRRQSRRIEMAKKDKYGGNCPQLPDQKRSTFKSFLPDP